MHLTRPKSSKGRSRPALSSPSVHGPPASPESSAWCRPDGNLRAQSQPITWHGSQDEAVHVLQHSPAAAPPPLSLNKYRVLPSIERRPFEVNPGRSLDKNMSTLSLYDDALLQHIQNHVEPDLSCSTGDQRAEGVWANPSEPGGVLVTKEAGARGSLLLAIRAPCGRRFQQHFDPRDTLSMVRASAEARFGALYGDASIETMDVPRRSFKDMDMTLAQCGILNKSVLCISQDDDSVMEHEKA
ncbi:hypothetical protein Q5P01_008121 [Channa striata]|uniref:UBX domain-containing protein n=1 Tax=Channa striata TaxID=64152 RepID=A0AA88SVG5_CHASR|nr:hypothetical protein Q5P01_008121 [Channa striata]